VNAYPINWTTPDGIEIFANDWFLRNPKAVVCLVHGFGEHCMRYDHLGKWLLEREIAMVSFDQRGHGQSGGKKGHTPSYDTLLDDIEGLLSQAQGHFGLDVPLILYGHSMGGNLVGNFQMKRKHAQIKGVILSSPWIELKVEIPKWKLTIGKMMRKMHPAFSQSADLDANLLSYNEETVRAYESDPLVHNEISAEMALSLQEAGKWLADGSFEVDVPMLVMQGEDDAIIDPEAVYAFFEKLKGDKKLKKWPLCKHEIHNEYDYEQVFEYIYDWINNKILV